MPGSARMVTSTAGVYAADMTPNSFAPRYRARMSVEKTKVRPRVSVSETVLSMMFRRTRPRRVAMSLARGAGREIPGCFERGAPAVRHAGLAEIPAQEIAGRVAQGRAQLRLGHQPLEAGGQRVGIAAAEKKSGHPGMNDIARGGDVA